MQNSADGGAIHLWDCLEMNPNQQWTVDDQGHIRYAVKTNMAIVYDSKTSTVIIVYIDKNKELGLSAFSK